jgi:hypothetical protein
MRLLYKLAITPELVQAPIAVLALLKFYTSFIYHLICIFNIFKLIIDREPLALYS